MSKKPKYKHKIGDEVYDFYVGELAWIKSINVGRHNVVRYNITYTNNFKGATLIHVPEEDLKSIEEFGIHGYNFTLYKLNEKN